MSTESKAARPYTPSQEALAAAIEWMQTEARGDVSYPRPLALLIDRHFEEVLAVNKELLEALEGMMELERHTHRFPESINAAFVRGVVEDAQAAIAKSRGTK